MNVPDQLRYTRDHEWVAVDADTRRCRIGITDFAQDALGDIVFVQLPAVGATVQAGLTFSEVESTKSVSDVYAPVSGVVVEVNEELNDAPQRINEDPYGQGWISIIELGDGATTDDLMTAASYRELVEP